MATTKKTPPTKKSSSLKTLKSAKNVPQPWSWRFSIITIGIYVIVSATLIIAAFFAAGFITSHQNKERLDRIQGIYTNLNLGDAYIAEHANVFGDKRVYTWDKGRTYSSEIDYLHADIVSNTVKDLDGKIKAAGFSFVDEPYPGAVSVQYHYKSAKGEYVRLTVSSKPYDDAVQNELLMNKTLPANLDAIDKNVGPANVIIKVNLDDNNE